MNAQQNVRDRITYHINITRKRSKGYYVTHSVLRLLIPILSAITTIFAAVGSSDFESLIPWISGFVTFRDDLDLRLHALEAQVADAQQRQIEIANLYLQKNQELNQLIEEFNQGPPAPANPAAGGA